MAELARLANVRHGWIWGSLPAWVRRVGVVGEDGLTDSLRDAGLDAGIPADGEPAVVGTFSRWPRQKEESTIVQRARSADFVAVAVVPERHAGRERPSRAGQIVKRLAAVPGAGVTSVRARRLARALHRVGLAPARTPIGETAHGLALGGGRSLFRRRGRATGALVTGHRRGELPSLLEQACAAAAGELRTEVDRRATVVLRTGAVMTELRDEQGESYLLRVAGGRAGELLGRSVSNRAALIAAGPPPAVRSRIPAPLGSGCLGSVTWTLERRVPGSSTRELTAAVWRECMEFLIGLHGTSGAGSAAHEHVQPWDLRLELGALGRHARSEARPVLATLGARFVELLVGLPRGWCHGDFWGANLLVEGERVRAVVDWDSAAPGAPPALDLMHLLLLSDRRARRLPLGRRCTDVLWPLARAASDDRLLGYCEAAGCPADGDTLEGLALAYWVHRVGRDLSTFQDRTFRPGWMEENLHRPLTELGRAVP